MKGFTLIEMMVSVALFSVVMVIALGSLLAISVSDRKAESLKAVINNLNFAVDGMSRAIRTGNAYGCGAGPGNDCPGGAIQIAFNPAGGGARVAYRLESEYSDPPVANAQTLCGQTAVLHPGCIVKSLDAGVTWLPITAPEVIIADFSNGSPASYPFYTIGTCPTSGGGCTADTLQPIVTITLSGYVNLTGAATSLASCTANPSVCSVFHIQTSVTQRIYDQ